MEIYMTEYVESLGEKVLSGKLITREEAFELYGQPLDALCKKADEIRRHFCADTFDMCTIINGKSGRCSENCRFCAQSGHNHTDASEYPLLSSDEIVINFCLPDNLVRRKQRIFTGIGVIMP